MSVGSLSVSTAPGERVEKASEIEHALHQAAHYLPAQAPLEVFVHHNTLHAYQHLHFHEAVETARVKTGARGYLTIAEYRDALARGRIRVEDLDAILASASTPASNSDSPCGPLSVRALRALPFAGGSASIPADSGLPSALVLARHVLIDDVRPTSPAGLAWELAEHEADRRFAPRVTPAARARIVTETTEATPTNDDPEGASVEALWAACTRLSKGLPPVSTGAAAVPRFPRDLLVSRGEGDPSELVASVLIPACASFLDRGQSQWTMPDRARGFFEAWSSVMTSGRAVRPAWLADLGKRLRAWKAAGLGATEVTNALLAELGVAHEDLDAFVEHTLLQLPGWAGMFHKLETAPGPIGRSHAKVRLADFLAVRLVLDVQALRDLGRLAGYRGPLSGLSAHLERRPALDAPATTSGEETTAWPLFRLAQHAGISAPALESAGAHGAAWLLDLVRRLDDPTRLCIWHEAYERRYREELLHALSANRRTDEGHAHKSSQVIFCIDDREESMRRHFEELSPRHETFGAAGFFNLAIAYRGVDDPSWFPLCPVVVEPRHQVEERAAAEHMHLSEARRRWRSRFGKLGTHFDRASRSMIWGPLLTALAGAVSALPLLVEVFAPRFAARTRRAATRRLLPDLRTELSVGRESTTGEEAEGARAVLGGFTVEEKASRVGTLLENIGLTRDFARVVAIVGHDSSSVNNPHFAAYSCGACGGRSGGPNARLFARMANRREVRELLRERGIDIPDSTTFVGAVHDTAADTVRFYDVDGAPPSAMPHIEALHDRLEDALARNAHERCRRFESAPRTAVLQRAHEHVEGRSVDLSEPRPELGHVTNASCIVGRRALTRGLFLDRRAFLVSYDPHVEKAGVLAQQPANGSAQGARTESGPRSEPLILERILLAVGPVCAGINLEYYFSSTDNERYGADTKLPHNVTALVGVMNGASSDLRTGLPKQMIEIHEPIRLQLVVESTEAVMAGILERQPSFRELVENEWLRLVLVHPSSGALSVRDPRGRFEPWSASDRTLSIVGRSSEWYDGRTGFVPPARIEPGGGPWSHEAAHGERSVEP